jgi:hypothetical protein
MVNYPPWADELLEPYFYKWVNSEPRELSGWTYIDVFWTNLYVNADQFGKPYDSVALQKWLDQLPDGKYFTIVQHDDGIREKLPFGTVVFALGGSKGQGSLIEPLPLIYLDNLNRLEKYGTKSKDIFCSFVGSVTHPVRQKTISTFVNHPDFRYHVTGWTNQVSENNQQVFLDLTSHSVFSLCPRGYGETSFRLYEVLKLGAIPVYIWEDHEWLPFKNKIDHSKLCVSIPSSELPTLYEKLKQIPSEKIQEMRDYYETVKHFFTLEGSSCEICHRLKELSEPYNLIAHRLKSASSTLYFEIEEAGFGAMLDRVRFGLGLALAFNMKPSFKMNGCRYIFPFDIDWKLPDGDMIPFNLERVPSGTIAKLDFFRYYNSKIWLDIACPEPPAFFSHNESMARHYWMACLAEYITKHANQRLLQLVIDTKNKIIWPSNETIIGIHIRRGDKIQDNPHVPVQVYMDYLNRLISAKNISHFVVFLTSDDPEVYKEFRILLNENIRILWDENEKRYNNANWKYIHTSEEIAEQESYTAAKNILLLGDCDYVIGTHNTQFTWLGGLLCTAKHRGDDVDRHIMIQSNPVDGKYILSYYLANFPGVGSPIFTPATI